MYKISDTELIITEEKKIYRMKDKHNTCRSNVKKRKKKKKKKVKE